MATNSAGTSYGADVEFTTGTTGTAPTAVTNAATNITTSGGTMNGSANPNGLATTASFQWGTTTAYGTTTASLSLGSGTTSVAVSTTLIGLAASTTYHYRVVATNSAGTSYGADVEFTTNLITYTLTVTKAGTGIGTVTSTPAGIDCGATCGASFTAGTAVTLTATPDAGSTFAGWSGDTSNGQVTMNADKNVTATFNLTVSHTLTVTKAGTGAGTVKSKPAGIKCGTDCNEVYNAGTAVTLRAIPAAGSTFAGWSGDTSDGQVKMNADKTCTATFNLTPVNLPDLVVTLVAGPLAARGGETIPITYSVMNQGSVNAPQNIIMFYLSTDTSITTGDIPITSAVDVPPLTPGASFTQTILGYIRRGIAGYYYIGAIVDYGNRITESNEGNNTGYDATPIFIVP